MPLEAIKHLSGARQLTKAVKRELDSISEYTAPSINRIISGKGGSPGDRVSRIVTKKERLQERLCIILELCFYFEEAAQAELETVDNLEFKALVIDRYIYDKSWTDIARGYENGITADALKKRFERFLKAYTEQNPEVPYSPKAKLAINWYFDKFRSTGIKSVKEFRKTSVDLYNEKEGQSQQPQRQTIDNLNEKQSGGEVTRHQREYKATGR